MRLFWIFNHSVKALLHSKFLTQVENKNPFSSFSFSWRNLCFSLRSTDDSLWGFFLVFLAGCLYCSCSYWNLRKGACRLGIVVAITSKATFLFLTDRAVQVKEPTKGDALYRKHQTAWDGCCLLPFSLYTTQLGEGTKTFWDFSSWCTLLENHSKCLNFDIFHQLSSY